MAGENTAASIGGPKGKKKKKKIVTFVGMCSSIGGRRLALGSGICSPAEHGLPRLSHVRRRSAAGGKPGVVRFAPERRNRLHEHHVREFVSHRVRNATPGGQRSRRHKRHERRQGTTVLRWCVRALL